MHKEQSHAHHYVPRWYQKRFLTPGRTKFFYLDLDPETVVRDGVAHQRKALLNWGPARCFYRDDLYTLKLGTWTTDEIERYFFGDIDRNGHKAVELFGDYKGITEGAGPAFQNLISYMDAQRFRTPAGLDFIKKQVGSGNHNATLVVMQQVFLLHATMWTEAVWEIVRARRSPTKFIVTDGPVTFFNRRAFPSELTYPDDVGLDFVGTRTLFPLALDSCLILTHLQFTRDPWTKPLTTRVNARAYQNAFKHLGDIQFGQELEEDEVLRINYVLKRRATRYIAAAEEKWLYPERRASTTQWAKLDDDWFLLPHLWKIPFTSEIIMGHQNGSVLAADEYGRHPWNPKYRDEGLREKEWETRLKAQREWAKRRVGKSVACVDERLGRDVGDKLMENYLRGEGILTAPDERQT